MGRQGYLNSRRHETEPRFKHGKFKMQALEIQTKLGDLELGKVDLYTNQIYSNPNMGVLNLTKRGFKPE